jgi:hypothetical protein
MLSRPATVNIGLGSELTDLRQGSTRSPTSSTPPRPSTRSQGHPFSFQSRRGGGTAVVLYSLTGARKRHDINPLASLRDVLPRLSAHPADQLDERLPDVRFASHPSARRETAAWAGVEAKPGSQPVVRRAKPRPRILKRPASVSWECPSAATVGHVRVEPEGRRSGAGPRRDATRADDPGPHTA